MRNLNRIIIQELNENKKALPLETFLLDLPYVELIQWITTHDCTLIDSASQPDHLTVAEVIPAS